MPAIDRSSHRQDDFLPVIQRSCAKRKHPFLVSDLMSSPRAFVTGITGQDGSYLAELLISKGYEVHGLVHRPDALPASNIRHLFADAKIINKQLFLHNGAFEDATHLRRIINRAKPDEFYHLAGQS